MLESVRQKQWPDGRDDASCDICSGVPFGDLLHCIGWRDARDFWARKIFCSPEQLGMCKSGVPAACAYDKTVTGWRVDCFSI